MNKLAYRIQSLRPRTLPLSVSGIILGSFLAYPSGNFSWPVFGLALLTTLSLQIVSNLANDLGDMKHGTDNENRLGPTRALQAGALSVKDYKRTVAGFCLLAVFFGISLIYKAFGCLFCANSYILLCGGTLAILAALGYTLGTQPYGYRGLGDVFVFLFFGLLSTCGSYFLMRPVLSEIPLILLPASGAGFFITGVLNVNNIRDRENDAACGKHTIAVKLGLQKAKIYHFGLIIGGWLLMTIYSSITFDSLWNFLYILSLPLFVRHLYCIAQGEGRALDPQLKFLSISTLAFCILAAIGLCL